MPAPSKQTIYDVIIVGAGPAGLTLASSLGAAGLKVLCLDRQEVKNRFAKKTDTRTTALSYRSAGILKQNGVWKSLTGKICPILHIRVADDDAGDGLDFNATAKCPFGYIVENDVFYHALYLRVCAMPAVKIIAPVEIKKIMADDAVAQVTLQDGRKFASMLVVAADGRDSLIRKMVGLRTYGWKYNQQALVCTIKHTMPHKNVAVEHFLPAGPLATLPMLGGRSSIVWTVSPDTAKYFMAQDSAVFIAALQARVHPWLGSIKLLGRVESFPLALRHAEKYVGHRVVLLGDAAHGIHPIAGQGFNLGMGDIGVLANVLTDAFSLGLDLGNPKILHTYERARKFDNGSMVLMTDILDRLFSNSNPCVSSLRRFGLGMVQKIHPLKQFFMHRAMGKARLFLFLCLFSLSSTAWANGLSYAIAMHGAPKEKPNFTNFSYTDANAPKGGVLRLGAVGSFDTLNPFALRGRAETYLDSSHGLVYQPLMARSWDEPFTLYPLIAESVEMPENRAWIIFHINPKARWQDGAEITADDVLFSFKASRDKGRPNQRLYYKKVAKAEVLDKYRIRFNFKPDVAGGYDFEMPLIIGLMTILPRHDWLGRDLQDMSWRIPIGSGPYKISAVKPGRDITYQRVKDYWGADISSQRGLYNFDKIKVDYYRDDTVALEAFRAGQYDVRREGDVAKWNRAYDKKPTITMARIPHHRAEPVQGFVFNARRKIFDDGQFRHALDYSFNADWVNLNLFHGQYKRIESFYPNTELASPLLPAGQEAEILKAHRAQIPPHIFTQSVRPMAGADRRDNLLTAARILHDAGYVLRDQRLYPPNGNKPVAFEILLNDARFEKVALVWVGALSQLGITARVRTVDSAQYQARLTSFDYDVIVGQWINTLSPGQEQMFFWGSAAADSHGSRNYAGIKNPVIDALASKMPKARSRGELVALSHALDRMLMSGHYMIPFFYLGHDLVTYYHDRVQPPKNPSLYGMVVEAWYGAIP